MSELLRQAAAIVAGIALVFSAIGIIGAIAGPNLTTEWGLIAVLSILLLIASALILTAVTST